MAYAAFQLQPSHAVSAVSSLGAMSLKLEGACTICAEKLPLGARPVLQMHSRAKILIAGQAPGKKVHDSGVPFDDASGKHLREWLGITKDEF